MASPFPFTAGQVLTAAQLNAIGEWTSYTPTLTGVTIGDGTLVAEYAEVNEIVFYRVKFTLGSTSLITANVAVSLPFTADETYLAGVGGGAHCEQSGSPDFWGPIFRLTTTDVAPCVLDTSSTYGSYTRISTTVPFTWGSGNILTLEDFYKPA